MKTPVVYEIAGNLRCLLVEDGQKISVGRSALCDVQIDGESISDIEASIQFTNQCQSAIFQSSGGEPIEHDLPLTFSLSGFDLIFSRLAATSESCQEYEITLQGISADKLQRSLKTARPLLLGASDECDVVLPSADAVHMALSPTTDGRMRIQVLDTTSTLDWLDRAGAMEAVLNLPVTLSVAGKMIQIDRVPAADDARVSSEAQPALRPAGPRVLTPMVRSGASGDFWISRKGRQHGPFTEKELRQEIVRGGYDIDDLAWKDGQEDWVPLNTLINISAPPPAPFLPVANTPLSSTAATPNITVANQAPPPVFPRGVIIASWVLIGLLCLGSFVPVIGFGAWALAWPVLLATFVLGIIALTRKATLQGILILIATLVVVPAVILVAPFISTIVAGAAVSDDSTQASKPKVEKSRAQTIVEVPEEALLGVWQQIAHPTDLFEFKDKEFVTRDPLGDEHRCEYQIKRLASNKFEFAWTYRTGNGATFPRKQRLTILPNGNMQLDEPPSPTREYKRLSSLDIENNDRASETKMGLEGESVSAKADPASANIGDLVKFDDSEWTVIQVRELGSTLRIDELSEPKHSEGKFIYVKFKVKNITNKEESILFTPVIVDSKGRRFEQFDDQALYLPDGEESMTLEQLPSGLSKTFSAIFEVPNDAAGISFMTRNFAAFGKDEKPVSLGFEQTEAATQRPAESTAMEKTGALPLVEEKKIAITKDNPFVNILGMRFVPAGTPGVLFSVWETRVRDFAAYVEETGHDSLENNANGCQPYTLEEGPEWKQKGGTWKNPRFPIKVTDDHPVTCVSYLDAEAFCIWLTRKERKAGLVSATAIYRLPTDDEWSRACGNSLFPWGERFPPDKDDGNYLGEEGMVGILHGRSTELSKTGYQDGWVRSAEVGMFRPNTHGLYDMGGNVWEFCATWYSKDLNSEEILRAKPMLTNDDRSKVRVVRGGAWDVNQQIVMLSGVRNFEEPRYRASINGFRCVLVGQEQAPTVTGVNEIGNNKKPGGLQDKTFQFKKFYLGMPVNEALSLINSYVSQTTPTTPLKSEEATTNEELAAKLLNVLGNAATGNYNEGNGLFQLFRDDEGIRVARSENHRPFAKAGSDGKVNAFEITKGVRDMLFESAQIPTEEFLKNFINSYNVPSLTPSRVELTTGLFGVKKSAGFQSILQHRSPDGFEITYWDNPLVFDDDDRMLLNFVPAESLTIKKIETEKERKSKFD